MKATILWKGSGGSESLLAGRAQLAYGPGTARPDPRLRLARPGPGPGLLCGELRVRLEPPRRPPAAPPSESLTVTRHGHSVTRVTVTRTEVYTYSDSPKSRPRRRSRAAAAAATVGRTANLSDSSPAPSPSPGSRGCRPGQRLSAAAAADEAVRLKSAASVMVN